MYTPTMYNNENIVVQFVEDLNVNKVSMSILPGITLFFIGGLGLGPEAAWYYKTETLYQLSEDVNEVWRDKLHS
jgi:hypothetical protein